MVIRYKIQSWLATVFFIDGTVIPYLRVPCILLTCWAFFAHCVLAETGWKNTAPKAFDLFGHFVIFFVVFRTNQAYTKFKKQSIRLKYFQTAARELHMTYFCYIKGGMFAADENQKRQWEASAVRAKTDVTRYILAFLVLTKMHSLLAYNGYMRGFVTDDIMDSLRLYRVRVRGLLTKEEFKLVDNLLGLNVDDTQGSSRALFLLPGFPRLSSGRHKIDTDESKPRPAVIIIYFLVCLHRDCAVFAKQWGWLERVMNLAVTHVHQLNDEYERMSQSISTPAPLPINHICKFLMFWYVFLFPFMKTEPKDGFIVAISITLLICLCILGLEAISMEIEDPWGEDVNDLDVMDMINQTEATMYELMVLRKDASADNFVWIQPGEVQKEQSIHGLGSSKRSHSDRFLCLVSEKDAVFELWPGCSETTLTTACDPVRPQVTTTSLAHLSTPRSRFAARAGGVSLWRMDNWSWSMITPRQSPREVSAVAR